jgi:hypothetical protein
MPTLNQQLNASLALEEPMSTDLAKSKVLPPVAPMTSVIEMAIMQNASIDTLERLLAMQERWEANQAVKAYNVAFSAFKAESIRVVKNVTVSDGPLKGKKYADLYGVVSAVIPVLSKHGLSHSWKLTKDEPTWMEVTCTIRHELGHFESVSMGAAPDTGPGRNAIQARGSAKSYLERYTLLAAIGMAATDDDGNGGGGGKKEMDKGEYDRYCGLIANAQTLAMLDTTYQAACDDAGEDMASKKEFKRLAGIRYKELGGQ